MPEIAVLEPPLMTREEFLQAIEAERDADETDTAFCGRMGIEPKTYRNWKQGKQHPFPSKMEQVLERLRLTSPLVKRGQPAPPSSTKGKGPRDMTWQQRALIAMVEGLTDSAEAEETIKFITDLRAKRADGGAAPSRAERFRTGTDDRRHGRDPDTGERRRADER